MFQSLKQLAGFSVPVFYAPEWVMERKRGWRGKEREECVWMCGAEGNTPSWTRSRTPRNLLSACLSQEGLPSPNSFLQTQAQSTVVSCWLNFLLHIVTWPLLPCSWTQHKFIQGRKELNSCGRPEAVDFSLSEQTPGLQSSNHCPVFPVGSAEMSGPQPCFSWLFPQSN